MTDPRSSSSTEESPKRKQRWKVMDEARDWTLSILAVFIAIKVAMVVTEPSIELKWYEWFLAPASFTYQNLIASLVVFAVYIGVMRVKRLNRPARLATLGLMGVAQIVLTFVHIASLRVEHIIRTYPTFEMTEADSEASIFTSSLLDVSNLPYTLSGLLLSVLAIVAPLLLFRRLKLASLRVSWRRWLVILAVWIGLGVGCEMGISSDVGVATADPFIHYLADLASKKLPGGGSSKVKGFDTLPIYGEQKVMRTSRHFEHLNEWRATKKNVLLIVMESSPVRQISFMRPVEGGKDTMPNLRKLRKNMLTLENHYSVHPTSMNALFSIGCSLYPNPGGGIITHINPRIPCHSISEVFAKAKYKTALFHSGKFSFWAKRKFYNNRGFSIMKDAKSMPGRQKSKQFKWGIDELTTARAVSNYIQKNKDTPFFIQYIPVFPHVPYDNPEGDHAVFPNRRPEDKYHNSLRYADKAFQIVFDGLRKAGVLKDTLVAIVGDHGEAFLEHKGNRVHSIYVYEENVHVAAALYNPILFPKHRAVHRVTGHIDLLPTIVDIVGLPAGEVWEGHSLLKDAPSPLTYFYADWGPKFIGMRDGQFKVIYDLKKSRFEIYDLKSDPEEKKNLADRFKKRLERYRHVLTKWREYHIKLIPNLGK